MYNVKTNVKDNRIFQQDNFTVTNTFHSCANDKGDAKINKSILELLVTHRQSLPPHCSVSSVYAWTSLHYHCPCWIPEWRLSICLTMHPQSYRSARCVCSRSAQRRTRSKTRHAVDGHT